VKERSRKLVVEMVEVDVMKLESVMIKKKQGTSVYVIVNTLERLD
jgi:hypothetical protein